MKMPQVTVAFDDGPTITVQPKSRDLLKLEESGVNIEDTPAFSALYRTTFAALQRMERCGALPDGFVLPESAEAFMDVADLEAEDDDSEGEGSGQAATTG